jgi:hypothetical protein
MIGQSHYKTTEAESEAHDDLNHSLASSRTRHPSAAQAGCEAL